MTVASPAFGNNLVQEFPALRRSQMYPGFVQGNIETLETREATIEGKKGLQSGKKEA